MPSGSRRGLQKKDTTNRNRTVPKIENKSEKVARKIEPLRGYLLTQYIKCGRANCKCANGSLHGPYHYRVWNASGRRYKQYIKKSDLGAVKAGIQEHNRQRAEIRALDQRTKANWRRFKSLIRELAELTKSEGRHG